ncbi:hypothetical protein [Roseivirga sp. UBA1976]|uniref:hypothetical protein n=1 Tax=Roseivirga sp. UBA1976 TaxID=1947386 RepID=UPI00257C2408|nr:hypothetical protein [Roseivirga sp. UBA1976]|tara:strand:+ start:5352 stop:5597 length:246 start_codon:yes stop_codon:yes gene_type:complete
MKIETKFNKGDKVWTIENNQIVQFPIQDVQYKYGAVSYELQTHKSQTIGLDKDRSIIRNEKECFGSIQDLADYFISKNETK